MDTGWKEYRSPVYLAMKFSSLIKSMRTTECEMRDAGGYSIFFSARCRKRRFANDYWRRTLCRVRMADHSRYTHYRRTPMISSGKITPCLWFDGKAEEAANFYLSIFPNSRITSISRYTEAGRKQHGQEPGTAMVVAFELDGQKFTGLNGGPQFKFNEAISFQIDCASQAEVDHYWEKLSAGSDPKAQVCGWLKDKFGVSWQVVPRRLIALLADPDKARAGRVMEAMMRMKKIVIDELERA
jgi:predicted 3-demethylubiquinone-9 3-methyltransferase (glyoxalase superfamily)